MLRFRLPLVPFLCPGTGGDVLILRNQQFQIGLIAIVGALDPGTGVPGGVDQRVRHSRCVCPDVAATDGGLRRPTGCAGLSRTHVRVILPRSTNRDRAGHMARGTITRWSE